MLAAFDGTLINTAVGSIGEICDAKSPYLRAVVFHKLGA